MSQPFHFFDTPAAFGRVDGVSVALEAGESFVEMFKMFGPTVGKDGDVVDVGFDTFTEQSSIKKRFFDGRLCPVGGPFLRVKKP